MATADELAAIPLLASLTGPEREQLASDFVTKTVEAGSRLIGEGAPGYSFFILAAGSALVTAGRATIGELGPGDFFGEIAILQGSRRTASVTATSRSTLLVMSAGAFRGLQQAHPEIAADIEATMQRRHTAATRPQSP
jgi:CRP-like cAMP-binding protein